MKIAPRVRVEERRSKRGGAGGRKRVRVTVHADPVVFILSFYHPKYPAPGPEYPDCPEFPGLGPETPAQRVRSIRAYIRSIRTRHPGNPK